MLRAAFILIPFVAFASAVALVAPDPGDDDAKWDVLQDSHLDHADPLIPPCVFHTESDHSSDSNATFHPHGEQICASGCAASRHPTEVLSEDRFRALMLEYVQAPMSRTNTALESLLYFGPQTQRFLQKTSTPITNDHIRFLATELKRRHVRLSARVVDENGVVRASILGSRVPLDRRHVFEMETKNLQPHVISGTVKRVGLDHLWVRL